MLIPPAVFFQCAIIAPGRMRLRNCNYANDSLWDKLSIRYAPRNKQSMLYGGAAIRYQCGIRALATLYSCVLSLIYARTHSLRMR